MNSYCGESSSRRQPTVESNIGLHVQKSVSGINSCPLLLAMKDIQRLVNTNSQWCWHDAPCTLCHESRQAACRSVNTSTGCSKLSVLLMHVTSASCSTWYVLCRNVQESRTAGQCRTCHRGRLFYRDADHCDFVASAGTSRLACPFTW
jgi:hypothetical protein